jgi:TRAP-type C4-dicarboxylate transport system permease small subunit
VSPAGLLRGLDRAVAATAAAALVMLLTVVSLGIVMRAAGRPLSWTDEMSGYLMVWLACLGWILATRRGAHIRIRYFQHKLPSGGRRGFEVVIQGAMAVVGLVIGVQSIHLVAVNHDIEAVSIPISTAWMYVPMIPAGFVMAAQAVADLVRSVSGRADALLDPMDDPALMDKAT